MLLSQTGGPDGKPSGVRRRDHEAADPASFSAGGAATAIKEAQAADKQDLSTQPEWQLALRVAASKGLSKSELLQKFLLSICEQQLLGNGHEITEQRVGTQIFNRPSDYNPGEDNIVRSYARLLRKRLDEYFEGEGGDEPIRIVVPRGGYVPSFCRHTHSQTAQLGETQDEETGVLLPTAALPNASSPSAEIGGTFPKTRSLPAWAWILVGVIAGILLTSAGWLTIQGTHKEQTNEPAHLIWTQLFQRNRNTVIVPSDSGLGILQNLTGRLVTLEEYVNGSYLADDKPVPGLGLENLNDLRRQHYTSVANLNVAARLIQLSEFTANRSQLRFARSITAEDLKSSNVILLGSKHTNPWVSLFENDLNFRLEYMPKVDQSFISNKHPLSTEQTTYVNGTGGTADHTYGVIDYLPNLDGTGHVLILQGLNMAGTEAAADILFNRAQIEPVLKHAALSDGSLKPFELLFETSTIGASAPDAHILSTRFYPE